MGNLQWPQDFWAMIGVCCLGEVESSRQELGLGLEKVRGINQPDHLSLPGGMQASAPLSRHTDACLHSSSRASDHSLPSPIITRP